MYRKRINITFPFVKVFVQIFNPGRFRAMDGLCAGGIFQMKNDALHEESPSSGFFEKYRAALRDRVGDAKYRSWFIDLGLSHAGDGCITLSTASRAKRDMIDNRFLPVLVDTWRQEVGPVHRMLLTVREKTHGNNSVDSSVHLPDSGRLSRSVPHPANSPVTPCNASDSAPAGVPAKRPAGAPPAPVDFRTVATAPDIRRTFDAFAVGESNQIAWAAAQRALCDGWMRELIYIYGPSGVGKTHLLHAVTHEWEKRNASGPAAYVTYSNFSNACIGAIWSNSVKVFHDTLLANELVSIDDVHLLTTKPRTQGELLNIIDAALDTGKQVVIAGELAPAKLVEAGINRRLADRLAGGICAPVNTGDEALRLEVLRKRLADAAIQCSVCPEVLEFIVRTFSGSTRETIGALNQVLLMYASRSVRVDLDKARAVLRSLMEHRKGAATIEDAMVAAAGVFGLSYEDITGRAQPQRIVRARHAVVWCAREVLKESFPSIGKSLKRDHTTVMSSCRRAGALLERDKAFRESVDRIREALEN